MEMHEYVVKDSKDNLITIEIPFEEYKELLIIKGKYEELKSQKEKPSIDWAQPSHIREPLTMPTITYGGDKTTDPLPTLPYKITCSK